MGSGDDMLRVKVPCADEGEFYARFADRIAANGLRVPADEPPAVGAHARVAMEFKDGAVLAGDAVVEEHVALDSRPGVKVRFLRLDRAAPDPADEDEPLAPAAAPSRAVASARRDAGAELADVLFADAPAGDGGTGAIAFTVSAEIAHAVSRRTARYQRAALAVAGIAVVIAIAGIVAVRLVGGPAGADAAAAAHVEAADRLLADGKLTGKDGALDRLLAARRLRPEDAETTRRLERLADLLERLAAGALERGDLAVASIHLASARDAAPARPSLARLQAELDRRARASGAR